MDPTQKKKLRMEHLGYCLSEEGPFSKAVAAEHPMRSVGATDHAHISRQDEVSKEHNVDK